MPRKIEARQSDIHGNGVFAIAQIEKGERVVEYKGKRRTHDEVDQDDEGDVESGHTFLFTLNDDYVIDANSGGNVARWINHSCKPNCEPLLIEDPQDRRVWRLHLMPSAHAIVEQLRAIGAELEEQALSVLSPAERTALFDSLERVRRGFERSDNEAAA